jgi:hypothetical protein
VHCLSIGGVDGDSVCCWNAFADLVIHKRNGQRRLFLFVRDWYSLRADPGGGSVQEGKRRTRKAAFPAMAGSSACPDSLCFARKGRYEYGERGDSSVMSPSPLLSPRVHLAGRLAQKRALTLAFFACSWHIYVPRQPGG